MSDPQNDTPSEQNAEAEDQTTAEHAHGDVSEHEHGRHAAAPAKAPSALLGPAEIRDLAEMLGVNPTKKLGQNFVIDANTVRRIVKVAQISPGDTVVEVGPGLGSLTLGLTEAGASVVAVEIDARLAEQLPLTVELMQPGVPLTVIREDALRVLELPGDPTSLVANLPYNVSVPVLLHLLEHFASIRTGVVMVQAEVGERIAAAPGSKIYGSPSVKAAWYGDFRTAGKVSRQVFWPVPNVDSILVAFERRSELLESEELRLATFALVDAAFQQRRKMLRQSLSVLFGDSATASAVISAAGIDPTTRGEQLTVHDFLAIAQAWPDEPAESVDVAEADVSDVPDVPDISDVSSEAGDLNEPNEN